MVSWDPRLPHMEAIQQKHWRAMTTLDPYLKEVFPEPPLPVPPGLRGWKEPAARSDRELGRGGPCLPPPGSALDPRPSVAYITASALRMGSVI